MKSLKLVFSFTFLFLSFVTFSQLSTGVLKMEVSGIRMNGEEAPPEMAHALGKMEIAIYSDGQIQKSVVSMMMMNTTSIMNTKSDSIFIYMDMMGKKYKITESRKTNIEDPNLQALNDNIEIKEFPEDVKEILGYKCHRVELKMKMDKQKTATDESQEVNMKMYVTKDLKFDPSYVTQTSKKLNLNGTPLEYNMSMGSGSFQMEIIMKAKEFKKDISLADLEAPSGNYKDYTMEAFQNEMSNMGKRK